MNTASTPTSITRHEFEGVEFISTDGTYFKGCRRCGGSGHYLFNGEDDICYLCNNTDAKLGDFLGTLEQAQKWAHGVALGRARADAKRRAAIEAIAAKVAAKRDALKAADPELHDFLTGLDVRGDYDSEGNELEPGTERDPFLIAMWEQLHYGVNADRPFTQRMVEASRKAMERRQAQAAEAAAHPAPSGAVVVAGEIVGTKVQEGDYGTSYKITVKDDRGFKVYASLPKAQVDQLHGTWMALLEANGDSIYDFGPDFFFMGGDNYPWKGAKGMRITFTATLTPSQDDVSFAFGSRPRKSAWL